MYLSIIIDFKPNHKSSHKIPQSKINPTNHVIQAQRIAEDGFPAETHHVTTSDGYILEMHRIPHGRGADSGAKRPVVFLMHGLMGASNNYIGLGPDDSLGKILLLAPVTELSEIMTAKKTPFVF